MKLYYSKGACSLSPHIVACEAGLPIELVEVDLQIKRTGAGEDFRLINPNGYVPVLILDDGNKLMEGPAIVQYLADQAPDKELAPPAGTFERYQLQQWLNFISTEIHKGGFAPLFNSATPEAAKKNGDCYTDFASGNRRRASFEPGIFTRRAVYRGRCLFVCHAGLGLVCRR